MININFLNHQHREGMEFIAFQSSSFKAQLESALGDCIEGTTLVGKNIDKILSIIEEYSGFNNIKVHLEDKANLGIDVAYFSPKHVFNSKLAESVLSHTESTMYRWFKENKDKFFKGTIDYTSGKVSGCFATIPANLHINRNLNDIFPSATLMKYKVTLVEALAGAIVHELGHIFGGCMMLATSISDNLVLKAALEKYKATPHVEERVVLLKDVMSIHELPAAKQEELESIAQSEDDHTFILFYNKLLQQRNSRRSLSVGVANMSSEVVADMYALRMGFSKGVVGAIGALADIGIVQSVLFPFVEAAVLSVTIIVPFSIFLAVTGVFTAAAVVSAFCHFTLIAGICFYFSRGYSGDYNADHRRFDDAFRQTIAKLREDKNMDSKEKAQLLASLEDMVKLNKELKPWYENTSLYRFIGWVFHGKDFKLREIEHYTGTLVNSELEILSSRLSALV